MRWSQAVLLGSWELLPNPGGISRGILPGQEEAPGSAGPECPRVLVDRSSPRLSEEGADDSQIGQFFAELNDEMTAPVAEDSIWRTGNNPKVNESFEPGASAPVMRSQNLGCIVDGLVSWFHERQGPVTL